MSTVADQGAIRRAANNERLRMLAEYRRRELQIDAVRYAPWQPAVALERASRLRTAAGLLREAQAFPEPDDACLEVGYGTSGWLADLLNWGVRASALHGIELNELRAARARAWLPAADLRVGDATAVPWPDGTFKLVVISNVVSSILDPEVRGQVCQEVARVSQAGGAILWYDIRINNPGNPGVRSVSRAELARLFPSCTPRWRTVTLVPEAARLIAPRSWLLAQALETIPFLRTHLIAVLAKP